MEHAEAILRLLDFCWFEQEIFAKRDDHITTTPTGLVPDLDREIAEQSSGSITEGISFSRVPSILLRSMSDQLSSQASFLLDSHSPNSVLRSPAYLRPIESGNETSQESFLSGFKKQGTSRAEPDGRNDGSRSRRRKKKAQSKSLSELEFEELKGFMDLGFVFTEEDKDSSLGAIIPGLQRLGKKDTEEKEQEREQEHGASNLGDLDQEVRASDQKAPTSSPPVTRPYLSETWEWSDRRKEEERPLVLNWNFPALSNEADMKDNLRWWAHTVASAVR